MSNQRRIKVGVMIYMDQDLLDQINAITPPNGRSAWIIRACEEQLERDQRARRKEQGE